MNKSAISTLIAVVIIIISLVIGLVSGVFLSGSINQGVIKTTTVSQTLSSTQTVIQVSYAVNTTLVQSLNSIVRMQDMLAIKNLSVRISNTKSYDVFDGEPFPSFAGFLQIVFHSTARIHWELSNPQELPNSQMTQSTQISPANQTSGTVRFPVSPTANAVVSKPTLTTTVLASPTFTLFLIDDECNSPSSCAILFQVNATIDYYY